jgi:hypothetical protein
MGQRVYLGTFVRGFRGAGLEEKPFPAGVVFGCLAGDDKEEVKQECFRRCYGPRACVIQELDLVAVPVGGGFPASGRVGWNVKAAWLCHGAEEGKLSDVIRWDVRLLISGPPT